MAEIKLTDAQRARIERNRQRALMLRNARLSSRPYPETKTQDTASSSSISRVIDTGGGFLLDTDDEETLHGAPRNLIEEPAPILYGDRLHCCECQKEFLTSYIYKHFEVPVCDNCSKKDPVNVKKVKEILIVNVLWWEFFDLLSIDKDNGKEMRVFIWTTRDHEGKHALITKTEAKEQFLLKDCDLDRREPSLKFILKKNPHHSRGEMKLYLKSQIVQRAHDVWGGEEGLEEAREEKAEKREAQKQRKFDKKVKELRRAVRTSTWKKDTSRHQHEFAESEVYNEETDEWTKTCKTCGYQLTYEKM